jgi:hypothetical protein
MPKISALLEQLSPADLKGLNKIDAKRTGMVMFQIILQNKMESEVLWN